MQVCKIPIIYPGPQQSLVALESPIAKFYQAYYKEGNLEFKYSYNFYEISQFLFTLDFSLVPTEVQQTWLKRLVDLAVQVQYCPNSLLPLQNMTILTKSTQLDGLANILKTITTLVLTGTQLDDSIVLMLATKCPLLETLDISNSKVIQSFYQPDHNFFSNILASSSQVLVFNSLKHLILNNVPNLIAFNLKANLVVLSLENCQKLTDFHLEFITSESSLQILNIKSCSKLVFEQQELNKYLSDCKLELQLDQLTSKGIFATILNQYPQFPELKYSDEGINSQQLPLILPALVRPANSFYQKLLKIQNFTNSDALALFSYLKEKKETCGFEIHELDLSHPSNNSYSFYEKTGYFSSNQTEKLVGVSYLTRLNLSNCCLGPNGYKQLVEIFNKLTVSKLKALILTNTRVGVTDIVQNLLNSFKNLPNLEELHLNRNKLFSPDVQKVFSALNTVNLANLVVLNISENKINDEAIQVFANVIKSNKNLNTLLANSATEQQRSESPLMSPLIKSENTENILAQYSETQNSLEEFQLDQDEKPYQRGYTWQGSTHQNSSNQDDKISDKGFDYLIEGLENNKTLVEIQLKFHLISLQSIEEFKANVFSKLSLQRISFQSQLFSAIEYHNIVFNNELIISGQLNVSKSNQTSKLSEISPIESNPPIKHQISLQQMPIISSYENFNEIYRSPINDYWATGLSIDGGGVRGIIPAIFLEEIANCTSCNMHDLFNCIGGTSIGGIMALMIGGTKDGINPIATPYQFSQFLTNTAKIIFGKYKSKYDTMGLMSNKYDESGIESVLSGIFGNTFLSSTLTNVLCTSVNSQNHQMVIFKSSNAFRDPEHDFYMRNCARATSAAPLFFSAAEFANITGTKSYSLIDGAIGKNDPTIFVLDEVKQEAINNANPENFFILSLGTGENEDDGLISKNAGIFQTKSLMYKLLATHLELDVTTFKEKLGDTKYRRFQMKWDSSTDIGIDKYDNEIIEKYKELARDKAQEFLIEDYGPFQDRSLCEWLLENQAKKKELI